VSQPFETQFGWHILKVDDRRAGQMVPFDAVKDRILASIIHQKAQQIADDLRAKAKIEYIDPSVQAPLNLPGQKK
jgi:peptidyl-prolyl cis-trans isomerase C